MCNDFISSVTFFGLETKYVSVMYGGEDDILIIVTEWGIGEVVFKAIPASPNGLDAVAQHR